MGAWFLLNYIIMIATKIRELQRATNEKDMYSICAQIEKEAEEKNFPNLCLKEQMLAMLHDSLDIFVKEHNSEFYTYHNSRILDTFYILDTL